MEVDKSKCLICEVSCQRKGLAFFRFPEEESRLKIWIKEISPLLDILKIQPNSLKENGRICARHFREKDFINCKHNSLVHSACPSLSVSNVNLNVLRKPLRNEDKVKVSSQDGGENGGERDVFQCGRCKSEFEILTEFLHHKRFMCQSVGRKSDPDMGDKTDSSAACDYLSVENSFKCSIGNQFSESQDQGRCYDSSSDQVFKIVSQEPSPEHKILSLFLSDNSSVTGSPVEISAAPSQIILSPQLSVYCNRFVFGNSIDLSLAGQVVLTPQTPEDGSVLLNNIDTESQVRDFILTGDGVNSLNTEVFYNCVMQNSKGIIVASEVSQNHIVTTQSTNPKLYKSNKDSVNSLIYENLASRIDVSQQTSLLDGPGKEEIKMCDNYSQLKEGELQKQKTKLPCPYCGKTFEKPFNLQQHERVHTGERPFQCIVCGRAFSQKSNVRKHMMRHRVWPKGKQTLKLRSQGKEATKGGFINEIGYSCQYCTLSFKSYAEHKKHLAVHSDIKVYRCVQKSCNETFTDLDEFLSHSKMHSTAEFQCHICLKSFTNLEELGAHQYDHDTIGKKSGKQTEIKLKCKVCHARFKTTESLKNHLAVDSHNYECVHCQSVFSSERFLRRHLFIHMDASQSKFKCQNCKKSFRTQQNLRNHVFIHLKEKPFTCDHCDKQFASKYRLKRHVAIHLNQYFECPYKKHLGCDKTFYRKDKLRDHVNTHSNCRLRSCRICSKMYWTLSKLHQHMKRDHKSVKGRREMLKCFNCSQIFRKRKQLSQHHCTVEGRQPKTPKKNPPEARRKEAEISEAVSNIEIIMVPFDANGKSLT